MRESPGPWHIDEATAISSPHLKDIENRLWSSEAGGTTGRRVRSFGKPRDKSHLYFYRWHVQWKCILWAVIDIVKNTDVFIKCSECIYWEAAVCGVRFTDLFWFSYRTRNAQAHALLSRGQNNCLRWTLMSYQYLCFDISYELVVHEEIRHPHPYVAHSISYGNLHVWERNLLEKVSCQVSAKSCWTLLGAPVWRTYDG